MITFLQCNNTMTALVIQMELEEVNSDTFTRTNDATSFPRSLTKLWIRGEVLEMRKPVNIFFIASRDSYPPVGRLYVITSFT